MKDSNIKLYETIEKRRITHDFEQEQITKEIFNDNISIKYFI